MLLLLLLIFPLCLYAKVTELTQETFRTTLDEAEKTLVTFYATHCGACLKLEPELEKASKLLSKSGSNVKIVKVDGTKETRLAKRFKIKKYPTLKLFKNGRYMTFKAPEKAEEIASILQRSPYVEVKTEDELNDLLSRNVVLILGLFRSKHSKEAEEFVWAAEGLADYSFALTTEPSLLLKYYEADKENVLLMKPLDEDKVIYEGPIKFKELRQFITANSACMISELTDSVLTRLSETFVNDIFILFVDKNSKHLPDYLRALKPAAKKWKEMSFLFADFNKPQLDKFREIVGLTGQNEPSYLIYKMSDNSHYVSDNSDITSSEVSSFVQSYFEGKLIKSDRSQKNPADWNAKPVKVVVAKTFNKIVLDNRKHVFIELFSPLCRKAF